MPRPFAQCEADGTPFLALSKGGDRFQGLLWSGCQEPCGGRGFGLSAAHQALTAVPEMHRHLDLAAGSEASIHFWENRSLPPFGAVSWRLGKASIGIILASEPQQGPLVPINAKAAVPGEVTPTRNEVAPPPRQLGQEFQKTKCLAAVLTSQDSGRAEQISRACVGTRGPAQRPEVLVLPGPALERQGRKECLNTVLWREQTCGGAVVILEQPPKRSPGSEL